MYSRVADAALCVFAELYKPSKKARPTCIDENAAQISAADHALLGQSEPGSDRASHDAETSIFIDSIFSATFVTCNRGIESVGGLGHHHWPPPYLITQMAKL